LGNKKVKIIIAIVFTYDILKLQKGVKQMAKMNRAGQTKTTGQLTIKAEHLIRSGINIGDEVQISVNSRKEIVIRKVTK
jgi:hypothetical protein